jgi:putative ABC transport system permease protein
MSHWIHEIRYAVRTLLKQPGFALVAVVTLALGIGANVAIFAVVNGMLLQPLPYGNQARVLSLLERNPTSPRGMTLSIADFLDWRERQQVFESMAVFQESAFTLTGVDEPERIRGTVTSTELLPVLGVTPISGRGFRAEDGLPGANKVVLIGYGLWQRRFGGESIVGRTIELDREPHTVIGVMAKDFGFPEFAHLWVPLRIDPVAAADARGNHSYQAIGLLKAGVSEEKARANLATIARQLEQAYPRTNTDIGVYTEPLRERSLPGELRLGFVVFMAVVAFVLLIACANIANLLLGRAVARDREMAVRVALGSGRWRILRLLMAESLLIAAAGSVLGLLLGRLMRDALVASVPIEIPIWMRFDIDATVGIFVVALTVVSGVTFGLLPSLRASRHDVTAALKESGTRSTTGGAGRSRTLLVVAEVAIAVVVLVGSGLVIRSFMRLMQINPGFRSSNLLTLRVALPEAAYGTEDRRRAFVDEALPRIRSLSGVEQAAIVSALPLSGSFSTTSISIEGAPPPLPGRNPMAGFAAASGGYFETMGIPLKRGRTFNERDGRPGTDPVVIVNETLAARHWPGQDPVGKRFKLGDASSPRPWMTVVGVVGDTRLLTLDEPIRDGMYVPHPQLPTRGFTVVVRTATAPLVLVDPVRRTIHDMDRHLPISDVFTMDWVVVRSLWQPRMFSWIFGAFGAVALVLAVVGVYGVVSYSVAQRTREIGIRVALGAGRGQIRAMVLRQGMGAAAMGIAIGLAGAVAVTRAMGALLYGVSPTDPVTFGFVTLVLAGTALVACLVPARRATKVDPLVALRYE